MRLLRLLAGGLLLAGPAARGQAADPAAAPRPAAPAPTQDLGDLFRHLVPRRPRPDSAAARPARAGTLVVLPAAAYTLEARLLASVTASTAYRRPAANLSTVSTTVTYTQNRQAILAGSTALWAAGNRSFWLGDYRLLYYPQPTYGLGSETHTADAVGMNYYFLRFHQSYFRRLGGPGSPLYLGGGYRLDYHWRIDSRAPDGQQLAAIDGYAPGVAGRSVSAGVVGTVLRDTRRNSLRPAAHENYVLLSVRDNQRTFGSDANYRLFQADARYYAPAGRAGNLLAFWVYGDFIEGLGAPYLDLPATGWDTYSVTGRGYIQGRFRGLSLLYSEAEYRFNLTRSRVLGGVVFANGQSARDPTAGFGPVRPAGGAGLRLCLAKKSSTYLAVDYAVGVEGSGGVFFNLGEVF